MALTATEIAKVTGEFAPALAGGWIQKIYQPTDRTLVLEIRAPGRTHRLLISCHQEAARLHFTTEAFQNPPTPPPFCQFLRAHLQGARIDQVEQIQGDRIVQLVLNAKEGPCRLVAELTGKTSNLLVLDDAGRIRRDLNGVKNLVGQLYVPPTHQTTRTLCRRPRAIQPGHPRITISSVGCHRRPLLQGRSRFSHRVHAERPGRDTEKINQEDPPPH